ncbi:lysylphosphatidylglycerol synthase domain-containing protein [Aestuariibaculum suncheonense]
MLIKLSLVIAVFCFIHFKLSDTKELPLADFLELTFKHGVFSLTNVISLLLLTIFNWFFEILKWQALVKPIKQIRFFETIEQCLGSLTVSLFTPNRIGEYGAKALFYSKTQIPKIVSINGLHNILQLSVTLIFGTIGLLCFTSIYPTNLNITKPSLGFLILIGLGIPGYLIVFIKKQNWLNELLDFIKNYPKITIACGFGFSAIRYLIFSFQFYYLLLIFGVSIDYLDAMMVISSLYLLASAVPFMAIFDFVIKGSIAVYLFSFLQIEAITIICITTLMWLLNFALPSLVGSYFVLNFKTPKSPVSA